MKNRRQRLIQGKFLVLFILIICGLVSLIGGLLIFSKTSSNVADTNPGSKSLGTVRGVVGNSPLAMMEKFTDEGLLADTNAERANVSVGSLKFNEALDRAATAKCEDMAKRDYWSHNTPEGDEPWIFVKRAGYKYAKLGENLVTGYSDSRSAVNGWMNSPEHKKNLLDDTFEEVGYGICESKNYTSAGGGHKVIVVQMLGTPQRQVAPSSTPAPKYIPPVCTKTIIPYITEYKETPYLYEGETEVGYSGYDGFVQQCTADSTGYKPPDYRSEPINRIVYVGTKPKEGQ